MNELSCSVREAIRVSGLGRTKLYELMDEGVLASVKIGKRRLVNCASLQKLCTQPEIGRLRGGGQPTHGQSKTVEYNIWVGMKGRCLNPRRQDYPLYGGRGITICDRWLYSFENFFADMGPRPSPKHSIDRIDGNGNYEPGNCRWATPSEQRRNRSSTPVSTHVSTPKSDEQWRMSTNNDDLKFPNN